MIDEFSSAFLKYGCFMALYHFKLDLWQWVFYGMCLDKRDIVLLLIKYLRHDVIFYPA